MNTKPVPLATALPQVDGAAARLRRCAGAARRQGLPASAGGGKCRLEIGLAGPVAVNALPALVKTVAGTASVVVDPLRWPALASAATLPEGPQRAAVAALLLGEHMGELAALVTGVDLRANARARGHASGVVLCCGELRLEVLCADEGVLAAVESFLARRPPSLHSENGRLRLPSRVLLGSRCIASDTLGTLRESDVVLLPSQGAGNAVSFSDKGLPAVLAWGDDVHRCLHAQVLLNNSKMTLTAAPATPNSASTIGSIAVQNSAEAAVPETSATTLARLEFPVHFELAGPLLSVAEIGALSAGDIVELAVPIEHAQVRITVAQQRIGLGELVAVGGRLGVRIVRMDATGGAP